MLIPRVLLLLYNPIFIDIAFEKKFDLFPTSIWAGNSDDYYETYGIDLDPLQVPSAAQWPYPADLRLAIL
eukprot:10284135-Karenia_brevis.AAC.1